MRLLLHYRYYNSCGIGVDKVKNMEWTCTLLEHKLRAEKQRKGRLPIHQLYYKNYNCTTKKLLTVLQLTGYNQHKIKVNENV